MNRKRAFAILVVLAAGLLPTGARAGAYTGYGDTGWEFYDKRSCCDEAVWLAQDDSMARCERAGGYPKVPSGSARGTCDWDARGSGRDRVYRCKATAQAYCR